MLIAACSCCRPSLWPCRCAIDALQQAAPGMRMLVYVHEGVSAAELVQDAQERFNVRLRRPIEVWLLPDSRPNSRASRGVGGGRSRSSGLREGGEAGQKTAATPGHSCAGTSDAAPRDACPLAAAARLPAGGAPQQDGPDPARALPLLHAAAPGPGCSGTRP